LNLTESTVNHYVSQMQARQQAYIEETEKAQRRAEVSTPRHAARTEGR
jgi:hypothetical protein